MSKSATQARIEEHRKRSHSKPGLAQEINSDVGKLHGDLQNIKYEGSEDKVTPLDPHGSGSKDECVVQ